MSLESRIFLAHVLGRRKRGLTEPSDAVGHIVDGEELAEHLPHRTGAQIQRGRLGAAHRGQLPEHFRRYDRREICDASFERLVADRADVLGSRKLDELGDFRLGHPE